MLYNIIGNLYIVSFDLTEGYYQYQQTRTDTEKYEAV